jgi:hypothetical protein
VKSPKTENTVKLKRRNFFKMEAVFFCFIT